ncbi:MAG: phage tail tape measure protein [Liquorilactobacillus nagelii]|jgi:phage-related tail protein|nr:phage tail tape measure protein [Liquorilactobacillus nagelii]MCI1699989.1 phage tail tape measure protein [Liquorilactobacillus nagelii]
MAEKIQGYQFAVDLDDGGMARSLKTIRDEAKALKSAMQSNFTEIKTSEGAMAAYAQKVTDAGRAIDAQRLVIEKLKNEQNGLDLTTEKGRQTYLKYEDQIDSSKRAISNLQAQQERAKSSLDLQASGVLKLKEATESAERSSNSYVEMLKAQGRTFTAQKAQLDGLRNVHSKMESQLAAEKQRLTDLSATYGTADKRYTDQIVRVNELSAKYATNRQEISKLNAAVGGMSDRTVKVKDTVSNATSSIKSGLSKVKNSAIVASGGIAVLGAAALSGAKKASTLQNEYKVTTNLLVTGGEKTAEATKNVAQMQKDGMEYSVKYGKSQKDIAEQYQELVKRGYSSKEALGAMRSELQASVASGDDFNDVVKVSSQVVDAFGMRTDNTTQMTKNSKRAVNELAYAADMTATDFQSLGKGMEYVGDSAHSAGFKLSETSAAMGELSNHGLEADKALVKLAA